MALGTFPQHADSAIAHSGRSIYRVTTNENGVAKFTLTPGSWWIVARFADSDNPFIERYWNVRLAVRLFGSKSLVLDESNGIDRWRY